MQAAVMLALIVAAPSPRDGARVLYGQAKKLCAAGDADGCLAKRLEGHQLYPNLKVMQAIVARYDEGKDVERAAAFLHASVALGQPGNAMGWCKEKLDSYAEALAAIEEAKAAKRREEEERLKAEAEAEAKAKADRRRKAEDRRRALEETARRADAFRKRESTLMARAVQEREDERTRLMMLGWGSAAVALAATSAGVVLALNAQSERDAAQRCQADLTTFGGTCSEGSFQDHRDAQASDTVTAFVGAGIGAVAATGATMFLYSAGQLGEATVAAGPGMLGLVGRF